jgi:hypothetical protein
MMKVFVLAVIGAACSSVAFAGEVKQTKAAAPVVKATTMSDAQMDKVTAGFSIDNSGRHGVGNNGLNGGGIGASSDAMKGQGAGNNNLHGRF